MRLGGARAGEGDPPPMPHDAGQGVAKEPA
jgi:hypothetical protein